MRTIACALLLAAAATAGEELLLFSRDGAFRVTPAGAARGPDPALKWVRGGATLRADGKAWFRARPQTGNGGVFLVSADGATWRRLTKGTNPAAQVTATRDGKTIVYCYRAGEKWQVYRATVGEAPVAGEPLTPATFHAVMPHVSPDGKLVAFKRERLGRAKIPPGDVVLLDPATKTMHTLLADTTPISLAFSPDGSKLAVGTITALEVFDVRSRKKIHRVVWREIDKRLFAHGPHRMAWSPDGRTLAFQLGFLGGRAAINGKFEPMFGDRELFFVPLDGKPQWITLPDGVHWGPVRWTE